MKGLKSAVTDLQSVNVRLRRMYGMGRLSHADYTRLTRKVERLRDDLLTTKENDGQDRVADRSDRDGVA